MRINIDLTNIVIVYVQLVNDTNTVITTQRIET